MSKAILTFCFKLFIPRTVVHRGGFEGKKFIEGDRPYNTRLTHGIFPTHNVNNVYKISDLILKNSEALGLFITPSV